MARGSCSKGCQVSAKEVEYWAGGIWELLWLAVNVHTNKLCHPEHTAASVVAGISGGDECSQARTGP